MQSPTKSRYVIVEGRVGPCRGDHWLARADEKPHDKAEEPVDPLADHDMRGVHLEMPRQRLPKIMTFRIAIHPRTRSGRLHRRNSLG